MSRTQRALSCLTHSLYISTAIAFAAVVAAPASGQSSGREVQEGWNLGLGVIVEGSAYDGVDHRVTPIPYIAYDWSRAHIGIDGAYLRADGSGPLDWRVGVKPRFPGADPEELDGLSDASRDIALELGGSGRFALGPAYISAGAWQDISGSHEGFEGEMAAGIRFRPGEVRIDLQAGGRYRDADLNSWIFLSDSEAALAGDATYGAESDWVPFAAAWLSYAVTDTVSLRARVEVEGLAEAATDSPLASGDSRARGLVILARRF